MIDGDLAAGFAFALAAAACYQLGYAGQALEARRTSARHSLRPSLLGGLLKRPVWVVATALSLIGWPLQILALSHAPLTLVQPTLALGLLLLLALGARLLGEPVGRRERLAVLIIIAAVGAIAWAAPHETGRIPRDLGLTLALGLLAALALAPYAVKLAADKRHPVSLLVVGAGAADALAAFVGKLIAEDAAAGLWISAAAWATLVAGVIVLGVIAEASALQRAAATRVAPAVLVIQIGVPVVLAPIVGGEAWDATPLGGAVLVGSVAALVAGVMLLGSSPAITGVIAEQAGDGGSQ